MQFDLKESEIIKEVTSRNCKRVVLQFPEGLISQGVGLQQRLEQQLPNVEFILYTDYVYGACCVDDRFTAYIHSDFLVHFGHSPLIPPHCLKVASMYIPVVADILLEPLINNINKQLDKKLDLAIVATIQYEPYLQQLKQSLTQFNVILPKIDPLPEGITLGCTVPPLEQREMSVVFIGGGLFHAEAVAYNYPDNKVYSYDPRNQTLVPVFVNKEKFKQIMKTKIDTARKEKYIGVITSTLGRQGNQKVTDNIINLLEKNNKIPVVTYADEISTAILDSYKEVKVWVQVACPRLSIDWGEDFRQVLITPYEAFAAFDDSVKATLDFIPMDNWSIPAEGKWCASYN
ncbi:diphthamide synthesis protein, putative [Entamoeba histolytica HM-1:IMSS-B]|uniref:2-(3-amino-3-carboxypropyl)histidine synthase subunit 1 n=4 Tax=Entamoeba histolytica TaxID=5759 RepID=C4LWV1_ENTH1|nr:diphthamide synthesis protein, putative [Entamoeba histolytica HM-1:IMSS]EAL47902.1 diphthamide synthesis protein, putative [Entamoeba histolytica HM-1:IMSS]EMH74656.1 diphthamide synthesis protein, putative [Entamoeba histolytica HM-1:IMSS-B]ENY63200.1 diphthamide biosynthesis protein, putative [Entamoeba histolytica HM-1:IMSS-A]GAT93194.1 diphthamide synthesis protein putative [Entamoeba histolytica]|eukprot:XP_653288.1 diphthamide synthesis protein, putative [Entamoeba histolytica HM-1:IMSS]